MGEGYSVSGGVRGEVHWTMDGRDDLTMDSSLANLGSGCGVVTRGLGGRFYCPASGGLWSGHYECR